MVLGTSNIQKNEQNVIVMEQHDHNSDNITVCPQHQIVVDI